MREVLRVAGLEFHEFLPRAFERGRVVLAARADQFVEPLHFRRCGSRCERVAIEHVFQPTSSMPNCVPQSPM